MDRICRFCGQPVVKFADEYDVFEQMHWLCYHLNFEHGNYDPDEPCDDPSCPWNGIGDYNQTAYSGRRHDVRFRSKDGKRLIDFEYLDCEKVYLPSISIKAYAYGKGFGKITKNVWYEVNDVEKFITDLKTLDQNGVGKAILKSMSPNDFEVEIRNLDKLGHLLLKYNCTVSEYVCSERLESVMSSGFEIEIQSLKKLMDDLEVLLSRNGLKNV